MKLNFVVANNGEVIRTNKTQKHQSVTEGWYGTLLAHFDFVNSINGGEVIFRYGETEIKETLNDKAECRIPASLIKYPGFEIAVKTGKRTTNYILCPVQKALTIDKAENLDTPAVEKMYKYACLCNEIYKECQKIAEGRDD